MDNVQLGFFQSLSRIEGFWKGFGETFFLKKGFPEKCYFIN